MDIFVAPPGLLNSGGDRRMINKSGRHNRYYALAIIISFMIIAGLVVVFRYSQDGLDRTLLEAKRIEVENEVEMLAQAIDADPKREVGSHEANLRRSVTYLDSRPSVFAAAYSQKPEDFILITDRDYLANYNPLMYPEFLAAIKTGESGWISIDFHPENDTFRVMDTYWRWTPLYAVRDKRFLIVTAVSKLSSTIDVARWIRLTPLVCIGITSLLDVIALFMLTRLGYIYESRENDLKKGKWRSSSDGWRSYG